MDINGVAQSIEATNNLVKASVTTQTEFANKMTNMAVADQIKGGEEEGKGKLLDMLA